jgi:hypothetical protein
LRIELPGFPDAKKISSIRLGPLKRDASAVILPELEEIDLLLIE